MPGDRIAYIEEYVPGRNTFDDGDAVRAAVVGSPVIDREQRTASIRDPKGLTVPDAGDTIVGTVAAVMSTMFAVAIKFINGRPITSGVECICSTRSMRRNAVVALPNDVVVLKIASHLNGAIHAKMDEPELGILFTKCRKCGLRVITSRDGVKCVECGWFDERKLSSAFGDARAVELAGG